MDSDDDDELLAQLEAELPDEEDDLLASCELALSPEELLEKAVGGETSLGLISASEMTDLELAKFLQAAIKIGSKVETVSLEAVGLSAGALNKLVEVIANKLVGLKALNLGGVEFPEPMYKSLVEYIETNRTLKQLHLSHCNLTPTTAKRLVLGLEKNSTIVDFQIDFDGMPSELQDKIDRLTSANRDRGLPSPAVGSFGEQTGMMSVWVKGPVHFGQLPPDQSGQWTRLTFDRSFVDAHTNTAQPLANTAKPTTAQSLPSTAKPNATLAAGSASTASSIKSPSSSPAAAAPTVAPTAAPTPKANFLFKVKAIYEYNADDEDEASFQVGDVIQVTKVVDEDWYIGRVERTGQKGQIPSNHTTQTE
ncbi:hypothetical protein BASA81_006856 [Batrachochytrium salamandrivorans]|nr:hypothetical protein BASA81_006856 [Batrachochytrium salamandrivorans]